MVTASFWHDTKVRWELAIDYSSTVGLDCQEGHYDVDRHGHF